MNDFQYQIHAPDKKHWSKPTARNFLKRVCWPSSVFIKNFAHLFQLLPTCITVTDSALFPAFTEQFECTASEERASNDAVLNAEWNFGLNNVATLRIVQEDLKTRLQHIHNAIKVALPAWGGKLGNFFRWKIWKQKF